MAFRKLIIFAAIVVLVAISVRYLPVTPEQYEAFSHYAVSVRSESSCDLDPRLWDSLVANSAYIFITWNQSGYEGYRKAGKSLLHLAAGRVKCIQPQIRFELESTRAIRAIDYALSQGEEINTYNSVGITALHTAALSGNKHIVKYLLSQGASPFAESRGSFFVDDGETPLGLAISLYELNPGLGHSEVIRLLEGKAQ